ncbi:hypothetical protein JaAD80_18015 [Janthinobacterium sp. AD80]|nr:hypothetical protein JaAD80_18015 [Janthinobacterium sp. AD80]
MVDAETGIGQAADVAQQGQAALLLQAHAAPVGDQVAQRQQEAGTPQQVPALFRRLGQQGDKHQRGGRQQGHARAFAKAELERSGQDGEKEQQEDIAVAAAAVIHDQAEPGHVVPVDGLAGHAGQADQHDGEQGRAVQGIRAADDGGHAAQAGVAARVEYADEYGKHGQQQADPADHGSVGGIARQLHAECVLVLHRTSAPWDVIQARSNVLPLCKNYKIAFFAMRECTQGTSVCLQENMRFFTQAKNAAACERCLWITLWTKQN